MKHESEITACVVDYGSFISLADRLGQTFEKVYYYSPYEQEFHAVKRCCIGDGLERVTRMDEFMDPDVLKTIDLFCFPDIGYGGLQRYLRSIGKLVWGSMGASDLELYRTKFLKTVKEIGLPVVDHVKITGLTNLAAYLRTVENKWIKVNRFRDDMETWHHIDWNHSQRELEPLAIKFGGLKEYVVFVVQDDIEGASEIGYDGFTVDGQYPSISFSGYEKKNELYLGSLLETKALPEEVQEVNRAMATVLEEYKYRNFLATEIRVKDDVAYFIDPTMRMAGQTMEHQFTTCSNLPEVILKGAAGELVEPEIDCKFAAEATMHYVAGGTSDWKVLDIPDNAKQWVKLYHYCEADGLYHFPPHETDEVGVICGAGDSVQEAVENLKENFELLKKEPLSIKFELFAGLINEIKEAEEKGIEFTSQPIPDPAFVVET